MTADWLVEIGAGAAVIEVDWSGFVDLRPAVGAVDAIEEAADPAMRAALMELNGAGSPVFTSKCEMWALAGEEIDADEFDCAAAEAAAGWASWIDVIALDEGFFGSFAEHEAWVRRVVDRLRKEEAGPGRVDVVVRAALAEGREGFGMTLYAAGCGVDTQAARRAWERVLKAAVLALMREVKAHS